MLKFSERMRNGQSPWIVKIYEQFFKDKTDGFLVEIGVGEVLDWTKMGFHSSTGSGEKGYVNANSCLLYTSPSPRDGLLSRMPSSA